MLVCFTLLAAWTGCGGGSPGDTGGERVLYVRAVGAQDGPFPTGDVYVASPDGTGEQRLTTTGDVSFPAWSYDARRIAMTRFADSGQVEVWIMNADGSDPFRLTGDGGLMPAWSPDGGSILFTAPDGGLWVIAADGTGSAKRLRSNAYVGSFSPDGSRIVYTGKVEGPDRLHNEIFTMAADGSDPRQLTFADSDPDYPDANAPSWSPDGATIAFFCGHEGDLPPQELGPYYDAGMQQVCVMNADDGRGRRLLTDCTGCGSDNPGWSPDGTRVFFDRGTTATGSITTRIIDLDGTHEEPFLGVPYGGGRLPWR